MSTGRIRDNHPGTHGGDEARRALVPRGRPARGSVGPHKIIARDDKPGGAHDSYSPTQQPFLDRDLGRVVSAQL